MEKLHFEHVAALEHLEVAQWHVASGSRLVQRQCKILLHLERDGRPAAEARTRLLEFEQSQLARIAHRDRMAATLGVHPAGLS
jgi:hypothetical protein